MKTRKSIGAREPSITKKPTHEEISCRAYALYELEGKPEGKALEHWFNAESMGEGNFGYGRDHTEHDFSKDAREDGPAGNYNDGFRKRSAQSKAPKAART